MQILAIEAGLRSLRKTLQKVICEPDSQYFEVKVLEGQIESRQRVRLRCH